MRFTTFSCPYCLRARLNDNNEGFFVVSSGVVAIEHDSKKLMIYEEDEFQRHGVNKLPVVMIDLTDSDVKRIEFRRFISAGQNYQGGKLCITGDFQDERGRENGLEKITIKMDLTTFREMKQVIQEIMED